MAKKRILFFVEAMGGGVFTYITNLANYLTNDFDIYVAYGVRPQTPTNIENFFDSKVHLIRVKNFKRQISISDIRAFYEMKKIAKAVQPDIIHLHSSKAGVLGRWTFNGKKIPVFYTPHGYSFLMDNISFEKKIFYKSIEKLSTLRNSTTISCSYGENNETQKLTSKTLYVDNGINIKNINKILKGIVPKKGKKFTIFTLGRISSQKNPELFNRIAMKFPEVNFVWIGDGALRNKLKSDNITITGWLNIGDALKKAINYDAFLLTSEWEGLPMALLEAMYLGKPCIVSNVIGNNNVISNNINGFLCDNISDYYKAINLVKSGKVPEQLIKNARESITSHYNSTMMAKNYADIYRNNLKRTIPKKVND